MEGLFRRIHSVTWLCLVASLERFRSPVDFCHVNLMFWFKVHIAVRFAILANLQYNDCLELECLRRKIILWSVVPQWINIVLLKICIAFSVMLLFFVCLFNTFKYPALRLKLKHQRDIWSINFSMWTTNISLIEYGSNQNFFFFYFRDEIMALNALTSFFPCQCLNGQTSAEFFVCFLSWCHKLIETESTPTMLSILPHLHKALINQQLIFHNQPES